MNTLTILLITFILFLLFLAPPLVKKWYVQKKYSEILEKYREEYKNLNEPSNIYNLEDYRKKQENIIPDRIIKHSLTHDLIWSDEYQDYIKTPRNPLSDDEEA